MNQQTRRITEGAMMVALVGVMLFVNRQFANMMEFFLYWILTFPILIYTAKYGIKSGITTAVCMLLLSLMISSPTTIFYLFCCIVVGLVFGEGNRRQWKNGVLLIWSGIVTFVSYIITTMVLASIFGYNPKEDMEMVRMLLEFLHVNLGSVSLAQIIPMIVLLSAVLMSVLQTICIHLISKILMARLKIETLPMKSMFDIHVSKVWGIIIIIIWVLFLGRNVLKLNQELSTLIVALFLCAFVFAIGYGALTCMMKAIVMKKRGLVFLIMIGIFIRYVQDGIAIVGILDMLFSLRERMKRGVIRG
ncbi:MAG: DUF2232 domain-containing protein [Longicatena sp.]